MKIIRGIANLHAQFAQCVLTMGNFDGVHLGHRSLLARLREVGRQYDLPTVVMIFEPQPLEFFSPDRAPARLTSFQEKYHQFCQLGIDYLLCIPFNEHVGSLSATLFVQEWLVKQLGAQYVIVGDDFAFGARRQGNKQLLDHYAQQGCFRFESLQAFEYQSLRVSSTAIRDALAQADFVLAEKLLGRPYAICGKVIHGNALARQLGFPTANVHLQRNKAALQGVFAVEVIRIATGLTYHGIANIGIKPTVEGKKTTLEVNIFEFNQDIYGEDLQVLFRQKIRDEQKFTSLDALQKQIAQDVCIAREIKAKF
ncbi:bifunctional riboflavin kinase/FAD synthetase [Utexia brackfieldae]|uniref:bifunctional riboflavin kinase/FAD synthetase n=1 Tax=Utexia brackfieldae TaxID=3074108 RepID=UPI00370D0E32